MGLRIKYIAITFLILLAMSYLYVKTKAIDLEKHNQLLNHFNQFMLIDSTLNQNILEIRQGLLTFYDSTVGKTNQLQNLLSEIQVLIKQVQPANSHGLTQLIDNATQTLNTKKNTIEKFKSTNAIFTNSLRYLPTATNQLSAKLPLDSQGDVVTLLLTEQLRDILIHNYSNDNVILDKFNETNKLLTSIFKKHYPDTLDELESLQAHANIIIKNKQQIDDIVNEILLTPSTEHTREILSKYIAIHNKTTEQINFYQKLLYALSIFLLLYVAYILTRLNKTSRALRNTVKDLNYQKLAMDQHAIVSIIDTDGKITYANDKFCEISELHINEIINNTHAITEADNHPDSSYKQFETARKNAEIWHGQLRNKSKSGEHYWVNTTLVPFFDENEKPYQFVVIQTNITDIIKATERLHLQSAALEVAANGIVITQKDAKILWVNKAFTDITGYTLDEVTDQTLNLLNSGKQNDAFFKNMWDTILDGKAWRGELINKRKDGSLYPEEQTISPVIDSAGKITHFISIKHDISKRQIAEEALRRSQKMEAIGQLSGGIAHDFNNQLGIVTGYLDIIKNVYPNDEQVEKYTAIATKACTRCIDLTRQLLSFSRNQIKETSTVNLNKILDEQKVIITRSMTPKIDVQYFLSDLLWLTRANPGEFQDAILNLSLNAKDAMPNGGQLTIKTQNKSFPSLHTEDTSIDLNGDYVEVSITDNGTGMTAKTIEHIYEPFFTTKPVNKGTGLGMAMVYSYVTHFNGHIKIQSQLGTGTTFLLYFPRSLSDNPDIDTNKDMLEKEVLPTGTESILIVDDEHDLLTLANRYLKTLGYTTYTASDAKQALKILAEEKDIDLLFSDIVMPGGIDGYDLSKKASKLRPNIKVLLTTGYTSKFMESNAAAYTHESILNKPYRKPDVAKKIRAVLDKN